MNLPTRYYIGVAHQIADVRDRYGDLDGVKVALQELEAMLMDYFLDCDESFDSITFYWTANNFEEVG